MTYCPNCGDEIAADAPSCPTCEADFGPGSAWRPLSEAPAHRDSQSIAEFKAETERRRSKREREERPRHAAPQPVELGTGRRVFGAIATCLILVGMVLELVWIDALLAEIYQPGPGGKSGGM